MDAEDRKHQPSEEAASSPEEVGPETPEAAAAEDAVEPKGVVETFRVAFRRARESRLAGRPASSRVGAGTGEGDRSSRNRDRTKTLFGMIVALVVLLVLFLGVFSSSQGDVRREQASRHGQPSLGRPGGEAGQNGGGRGGSVAPLLSADLSSNEAAPTDQVSPEDIGGTAHAKLGGPQSRSADRNRPNGSPAEDPAITAYRRTLEASPAPPVATSAPPPAPPVFPPTRVSDSEALAKPSLVFVRAASVGASAVTAPERTSTEAHYDSPLRPGTRLLARLQSAASTATKTPVVAVIEAHYERDGQIVVPAGTKAIGEMQGANRTGIVAIRFSTLEYPSGISESIDGNAVSLQLGPLKGQVSGTNKGKQFLARALTGVGTVAAFAVGQPGGISLSGPVDNSILLRERIAQNVGIAGEQELMNLAMNQDIVVTVPGNTRFFLVIAGTGRNTNAATRPVAQSGVSPRATQPNGTPSLAELRELIALKQELNRLNRESTTDPSGQPVR